MAAGAREMGGGRERTGPELDALGWDGADDVHPVTPEESRGPLGAEEVPAHVGDALACRAEDVGSGDTGVRLN